MCGSQRPSARTIVKEAQQPEGARPLRLFGAIGRAGLRNHLCEVASHHDGPYCLDSPTLGKTSRQHAVNDLQVEQGVDSKHATAAGRGVLLGSTAHTSETQQEQPGEAQRAPFFDLSMRHAPRDDADGRV